MTVKDLYEWAKARGVENAQLTIDYQCNDDWYDYRDDIRKDDILFLSHDEVCITIVNSI